MPDPWLVIVGLGADGHAGLPDASREALEQAEIIFGGPRHLQLVGAGARGREWPQPFKIDPVLAEKGRKVVVLASGDPFWHGAGGSIARHLQPGDWIVPLHQLRDRYVIETLEPEAMDSFFRWGFFDSVLDKKETFSAYVFEDEAECLLNLEPELRNAFETWKFEHPELLTDANAVLQFIFARCRKYAEPEYRRYPVYRITDPSVLSKT